MVATSPLHWSQPIIQHSPLSSSSTLASCTQRNGSLPVYKSAVFGTKFYRSKSSEYPKETIKRACNRSSSSDNAFSYDEFDRRSAFFSEYFVDNQSSYNIPREEDSWRFSRRNFDSEIMPESIVRKANSVDLPLSLRIIKRKKKQWQEEFTEAGESENSSVKKAFSSMVFIIRELHSYTLKMRELLYYEDLQGILARVEKEMHASFVWLFQQVFSPTPTLMVYTMILLANFTVYSMGNNSAICQPFPATTESVVSIMENNQNDKFDSSIIKTFSVTSFNGKETSIGGNKGGGGKNASVASGMDGGDQFDGQNHDRRVIPAGSATQLSSEEMGLWNSILEEADRMQGVLRDESLDHDTILNFVSVSPGISIVEEDDYTDYFRTELVYQMGLTQDPNNPLLLANYAQFLYLVAHDYDRAEDYFKKATSVESADAEAYNKYATFLWMVRKDLWAAEETYLEAISADPGNSFYAANYAHFLWNTGGEDTCFPLSSADETNTQDV